MARPKSKGQGYALPHDESMAGCGCRERGRSATMLCLWYCLILHFIFLLHLSQSKIIKFMYLFTCYVVLSFSFSSKYFLIPLWFPLWLMSYLKLCRLICKYQCIFQISFCCWFLIASWLENVLCIVSVLLHLRLVCGPASNISWGMFHVLKECVFCSSWVAVL